MFKLLTCGNLLEIVSDNFISVSKLLTKLLPKLKFDEEIKMGVSYDINWL